MLLFTMYNSILQYKYGKCATYLKQTHIKSIHTFIKNDQLQIPPICITHISCLVD
ncbi:hypothetical protein Hanom_Chr11g01013331 [Helianthus anomalus]